MQATRGAILAGSLFVLAACGDAEPTSSPLVDDADFVSRGGASLNVEGDPALSISLLMLRGVQPSTKNQRFIKATVARAGESFGAFCNVHGDVEDALRVATITCSIGVTTVSDDDNEFLSFDIVVKRAGGSETLTLERVGVSGDHTFLGHEAEILGHEDEPPISLRAREAQNPDKNALTFARTLLDATEPLLPLSIVAEEIGEPVAVKSVGFTVDQKLQMSTVAKLGRTGMLSAVIPEQSLMVVPGDLSKGVLDAAGIAARLQAALPK